MEESNENKVNEEERKTWACKIKKPKEKKKKKMTKKL